MWKAGYQIVGEPHNNASLCSILIVLVLKFYQEVIDFISSAAQILDPYRELLSSLWN